METDADVIKFAAVDLNIKEEPRSYDEVVEACKVVLDNSVR